MSTLTELDARGLKCPMPILRTKKALANLSSGEVLQVQTTDLHAETDFQVFARQTGHQLIGQVASEDAQFGRVMVHQLRKK